MNVSDREEGTVENAIKTKDVLFQQLYRKIVCIHVVNSFEFSMRRAVIHAKMK